MSTCAPTNEFYHNETVTLIIPAYNEALRIGAVLQAACGVNLVNQIIVIDDASTDDTAAVVEAYRRIDQRICLLRHSLNRGKAMALLVGATASTNDLVAFVDADLIGLQPQNLLDMINPVQQGESAMALGIFTECRRQTDWSHHAMPFLSGQRCLRWRLFRTTPGIYTAGWGIEAALSLHAWRQQYAVTLVEWPGVTHVTRPEKMVWLRGHLSNLGMWVDITHYMAGQLWAKTKQLIGLGKRNVSLADPQVSVGQV
ncbi:MAG: glycosyltransferase family 2 protein [Caldilineaceae bacterium]